MNWVLKIDKEFFRLRLITPETEETEQSWYNMFNLWLQRVVTA